MKGAGAREGQVGKAETKRDGLDGPAQGVEAPAQGPASQPRWDGGRSGRPAPAFDEAASGSRGWGIRFADIAVIVATVIAALAVCCVLWFVYGVQGVPGISMGESQGAGEGAASPNTPLAREGEGAASGLTATGGTATGAADDAPLPAADDGSLDLDAGGNSASPAVPTGTDAGSSSATQPEQVASDATQPLYAVVQNSDGLYRVLPLAENASVTIESSLGTNVIEVADGRVRCLESDCSNQTCVKQGWVSGQGQTIVCLPHKLTVQVVADPEDASPLR